MRFDHVFLENKDEYVCENIIKVEEFAGKLFLCFLVFIALYVEYRIIFT